ncbi:helix-turn-helix transcriptional regulator [Thermocatellispora tengchongensis]
MRADSGLTIEDVAKHLDCSPSRISRWETAQRGVQAPLVRQLCQLYGITDQQQIDSLLNLARNAKRHGWWQEFDDLDLTPYIELEAKAAAISNYETSIIPSLVQTEDYAVAIIRGSLPRIKDSVLKTRVEARMERRQRILHQENPPDYWILLDEAALHRHVGGPDVMREQLEQLLRYAEKPDITLQVIPYTEGAHMGMNAAFILLEIPEPGISDTVYIESLLGGIYYEKPTEVDKFREALDHLRAIALNPQRSQDLIKRVAARIGTEPEYPR